MTVFAGFGMVQAVSQSVESSLVLGFTSAKGFHVARIGAIPEQS